MIQINKIIVAGISLFMINALHGMDSFLDPDKIYTLSEYNQLKKLPGNAIRNSGIVSIKVGLSETELEKESIALQKRETIKSYSLYGLGGGALGIGLYTFCKFYTHQDLNLKEMAFSGLVGGATGLIVKSCDTDPLPSITQQKFRQMPLLPEKE